MFKNSYFNHSNGFKSQYSVVYSFKVLMPLDLLAMLTAQQQTTAKPADEGTKKLMS